MNRILWTRSLFQRRGLHLEYRELYSIYIYIYRYMLTTISELYKLICKRNSETEKWYLLKMCEAGWISVFTFVGSCKCGARATINTRCRWYTSLLTRSVNTQLALCGAWSWASWCYWSAVGCGGSGRLVVEVGWRCCVGRATCGRSRLTALRWHGDLWSKSADGAALETVRSVALHWGSLDGACCSVEPDEAGGLIWPVPTKIFADLLLLVVTLRLTERAARTRRLHCWRCTC
jgi:hypothetical protein